MKLTRKEIIEACEKHLIRMIARNIDKSALKEVIRDKYDLTPGDSISIHQGEIMIRNDQIVYKLDVSLQAGLSLLLDRNGSPLDITASERIPDAAESEAEPQENEQNREMAAQIARMISEINQE